jgi:hypothetical protein
MKVVPSARLAEEAVELAKAGKLTDAARLCKELAAAERAAGTTGSREAALRFEQAEKALLAKELASARSRLTAIGVKPTERLPVDRSAADIHGSSDIRHPSVQEILDRMPQHQARIFKPFEKVTPRISWISFVDAEVKTFTRKFYLGARRPETHLVDIGTWNEELVVRWKKTPIQKRVFLAGPGRDSAMIKKFRSELEAEGFAVFFYNFCASHEAGKLCRPETVGAFFATAGNAILADTPAAAASQYVSHEVMAALRLKNNQRMTIMVTPGEVISTAKTVNAVVITTEEDGIMKGY